MQISASSGQPAPPNALPSYRLVVFEGPLDLLLHLIAKQKLQIDQIEISVLLTQYLDYIAQMQSHHLDVTSEFLAMAAHLVYIKTTSLLPKRQVEQVAQLKQALLGQLIEYQRCKEIAARLNDQFLGNTIFVRTMQPLKGGVHYQNVHAKTTLKRAYLVALGNGKRRLPVKQAVFAGIVSQRMVSVPSRIVFLLERLYQTGQVRYAELFPQGSQRSELVATFLAMLELIKDNRIQMSEDGKQLQLLQSHDTKADAQQEDTDGCATLSRRH